MIIATSEYISGKELETIGLVNGSCIQTKNFFKDFGSGLKTLVGGELKAYVAMMNQARETALTRMTEQATAMGADAIISVRYSTSSIMDGAAEVMIYGTAVKFK